MNFAMYHSKVDKFNVVDATPFKRDVLGELAEACYKNGLSLDYIIPRIWTGMIRMVEDIYPDTFRVREQHGAMTGIFRIMIKKIMMCAFAIRFILKSKNF